MTEVADFTKLPEKLGIVHAGSMPLLSKFVNAQYRWLNVDKFCII
jgi:hypothetical protein